MKEPTAVEWLMDTMYKHLTEDQRIKFEPMFETAIRMEDERMIQAYLKDRSVDFIENVITKLKEAL